MVVAAPPSQQPADEAADPQAAEAPAEPEYATEAGHVYRLDRAEVVEGREADDTEMQSVALVPTGSAATLKQRILIVVKGPPGTDVEVLYRQLHQVGDLVLAGSHAHGVVGLVRKRRGVNPMSAVDLPGMTWMTPTIPVGKASRPAIVRVMRAIAQALVACFFKIVSGRGGKGVPNKVRRWVEGDGCIWAVREEVRSVNRLM